MRTLLLVFTSSLVSSAVAAQGAASDEVDGGALAADATEDGSPEAAPATPTVEGPPALIRLNLAECTARAMANSDELASERHKLEMLEAQVEQVWWAPFSSIGIESGFTFVPDQALDTARLDQEGVITAPGNTAVGADDDYDSEHWGPTFRVEVKGTVPLITFGRISRSRRAIEEAHAAKAASLPAVEQRVRYDVARAYHAIVGAREMLYTLGEGMKQLVKARELLEANLEKQEGTETETDLIKLKVFEAQVGFMEQQTLQIERTGLAALRFLVGGDDAARVDVPEDPQTAIERDLEPADKYKQMALENRPELEALRHGIKALEAKVSLRKSEFFPTIGLVLGWRYAVTPGRTDVGNWVLSDGYNYNSWYAYLALKYDLDLALDIYKLRESKAELAALLADQENALGGIQYEVETAYIEAKAARDSLADLEKSKRLTRGWIAAAVQNNAAGLGPAKEVKDALKEYFAIMASIHKLTGEYNIGLTKLDKVTGVLGEARD